MEQLIVGILMAAILAAALGMFVRYRMPPFGMMAQNKSEVPPGSPVVRKSWYFDDTITATENPLIVFFAETGITPLSLRFCAKTLDRADANETYVVSLEDDGTKISTNNAAAVSTQTKYEATFDSKYIAKDSKVEIIFTLGGTTPSLGGFTVDFDYLEG